MSLAFPTIIPPTENKKKSITRVPIEMQSGKNIDLQKVISFKWNVLISEKKYSCNGPRCPHFENPLEMQRNFH